MPAYSHAVAINPSPGKGEITVLFSGESQTRASHKVGPQLLDYYLLHFVSSGKGSFYSMGKGYELGAGSSFIIFPGELSSYESDPHEPWKYRWIGFRGDRIAEYMSQMGISPHQPVIHTEHRRRMNALLRQTFLCLQKAERSCDMQAGGYIRLMMAEYAKESKTSVKEQKVSEAIRQQVEQAVRWITLQYSQPVSIEEMARSLGYHRTHLSKMFKQFTGMSPMNFLLKVRMERAKLLLDQPLTIEEVASSVGFADPLYFSKQFKKWYGCSPTEFRGKIHTEDGNCVV